MVSFQAVCCETVIFMRRILSAQVPDQVIHSFGRLKNLPWVAVVLCISLMPPVFAADDLVTRRVTGSDFQSASEALIEAVEAEGLVVSARIPFNKMLERTAGAVAREGSPFANVEVVQFCSSLLAWQLLEEEPAQVGLCPLSITLYEMIGEAGQLTFVYRSPGSATAGRVKAGKLLQRLVDRSAELARLRW